MTVCNVCGKLLGAAVYVGNESTSITTMNKVIEGQTEVFHCQACDHVQTTELPELERFYAEEYSINEDGLDDDQLYEVRDGKEVYRSEHQASVLLSKLDLGGTPKVLDYGAAKGATLRRIIAAAPNVIPYLFDVTNRYEAFWRDFPREAQWASFNIKREWTGTLDVVTSFYALEHIPQLDTVLAEIHSLLRPGGTFYFIVPNTYANWADFIVADHVNHFSRASLEVMLLRAGFSDIVIDDEAHTSAFVVHCKAGERHADVQSEITLSTAKVNQLAAFWSAAQASIVRQEKGLPPGGQIAVYGAGVYGNFILACLTQPSRVACFLDQNRFLQGKVVNGIQIVHPDALPDNVVGVFAGLNPLHARSIIASVESLQSKKIPCFFMD